MRPDFRLLQKKHKHKKSDSKKGDIKPISEDDYFAKNPEFRSMSAYLNCVGLFEAPASLCRRIWLAESKDKRFGDLSEDDARSYFRKFVKQYNNGELSSR